MRWARPTDTCGAPITGYQLLQDDGLCRPLAAGVCFTADEPVAQFLQVNTSARAGSEGPLRLSMRGRATEPLHTGAPGGDHLAVPLPLWRPCTARA